MVGADGNFGNCMASVPVVSKDIELACTTGEDWISGALGAG